MWKLVAINFSVEIYRQDGEYIEAAAPGTLAEIHGLPNPWLLVVISVTAGALIGAGIAWVLTRSGWVLVKESTDGSLLDG